MKELRIVSVDPFAEKDVSVCTAKAPGGDGCLEKNPPSGKEMIAGHQCGLGCAGRGYCAAVFANRQKNPELFELL
jgi:hypothetical protein